MAFEEWRERAAELETEVYALYAASRDARTPIHAKAVIALTVAFAVSPVDPIPDFIPVVGLLDDLVLIPLGVALALRLTPDAVVEDCRRHAAEDVDPGRTRWVVAAIVLCLWAVVGYVAFRAFFG